MKIRMPMKLAAAMLLGTSGWSQQAPKTELAFDYSYARFAPSTAYTEEHSLNGGGGQVRFNIGHSLGIMADFQGYNSSATKFTIPVNSAFPYGGSGTVSGNLFTYLFGPAAKFHPVQYFNPFVDVLAGAAHTNVYGNAYTAICLPVAGSCATKQTPGSNGFAMSAGGGFDIPINDVIDIRVAQFDYLYTRFTNVFNDTGQQNVRFSTGLNVKMRTPPLKRPTLACVAEPREVLPWGSVIATASPADFNPQHTLVYRWESSGGSATGQGDLATVDITSLTPGDYAVKVTATDPKQKKNNTAVCTAPFKLRQPRPPTLACSASPATVKKGETVAITVAGSSPDLSAIEKLTFSTSSGSVAESRSLPGSQPGEFTTSATLYTSDAAPGRVTVSVDVKDVHGLSSTCTTSVEVLSTPAAPTVPAAQDGRPM